MELLDLKQGSPEWKAHRANCFNASDAPAMLGYGYISRDELLHQMATGESKPIDEFTQRLFDKGHAAEAAARPIIENRIGEMLYPITGFKIINGLPLSCSYDGLTITEEVNFEHKLWSKERVSAVETGALLMKDKIQMNQQMLLSGAGRSIFVVSDGTEENLVYCWYEPEQKIIDLILSGWAQFKIDLKNYKPEIESAAPEAAPIKQLPALNIQITGGVSASNLKEYEATALEFINSINTDLQTDADFIDAENMVKFCADVEERLELTKDQALQQTADISELFRSIDHIKAEMRAKRLDLNKKVKSEKESRKQEMVNAASVELLAFIGKLCAEISFDFTVNADFRGAIKGKSNLTLMQGAINDELARAKIEATTRSQAIAENLKLVDPNYAFLFNDLRIIAEKPSDDFKLIVDHRVNEHLKAEQAKIDAVKAAAKAEAEAEAAKEIEIQRQALEVGSKEELTNIVYNVDQVYTAEPVINVRRTERKAAIKKSLINNGIGVKTAAKVAQLIVDGKIEGL